MRQFFLYLLLSLFHITSLMANNVVFLDGYLGKDNLSIAQEALKRASQSSNPKIILEINSTGGNITQVLEFAKAIYLAKLNNHLTVIAYIADKAVGPAAILPFMA